MALTRYKILKRLNNARLVELGAHETNGPKQAMREEIKSGTRLEAGETLIAVPEGNWTEQGATIKVTETIELFDTGDIPPVAEVPLHMTQAALEDETA